MPAEGAVFLIDDANRFPLAHKNGGTNLGAFPQAMQDSG